MLVELLRRQQNIKLLSLGPGIDLRSEGDSRVGAGRAMACRARFVPARRRRALCRLADDHPFARMRRSETCS